MTRKEKLYSRVEKLHNRTNANVAIHSENDKFLFTTLNQHENLSEYLTIREAEVWFSAYEAREIEITDTDRDQLLKKWETCGNKQAVTRARSMVHSTRRYENHKDNLGDVLLDLLKYAAHEGKDFQKDLNFALNAFKEDVR